MEHTIFIGCRKVVITNRFLEHFANENGLFLKCKPESNFAKLLDFFEMMTSAKNLYLFSHDTDSLFKHFSSIFHNVEAAGGLVENSSNQLLLIKRNGIWDLPKGKTEKGEKIETTALREVSEECGIKPPKIESPIGSTLHIYTRDGKQFLKRTHWYKMTYNGAETPTPQQLEDITEAKWVSRQDIKGYMENTYSSVKLVLSNAGVV
jgi:8-oxo-dGTP pyrophosphatase MutT (NUDIX family)